MMAARRFPAMTIVVTLAAVPLVLAGAGRAAAGTVAPAVAVAAAPAGTWHTAAQLPGTAAHGNVNVASVSCGSPGNCVAGGDFVASEVNGRWHPATHLAGPPGRTGPLTINSVSCASAGNCAAGGRYYAGPTYQAFVASEVNGRWRTAIEVAGPPGKSGPAMINSVSCASPGNCAAGGTYGGGGTQAFVVTEVNGRWGTALEVPGTAALNKGKGAQVNSVSCASPGNCAAGGIYDSRISASGGGIFEAFVVSEVNGRWGKAIEVPGTAAVNKSGWAEVDAVSCGSAGNCAAGGFYRDSSFRQQLFVVSEVRGRWGSAIEVPGSAALNQGGSLIADVDSVSCASAGNCAAGGLYGGKGGNQAFVVSEVNGRWGKAIEVPGTAALNKNGFAEVTSVSCASAGNCAAGGSYTDGAIHGQAFVVSEVNGRWGTAIEVPGTAALNKGFENNANAAVAAVSCASPAHCTAVGEYTASSGFLQTFEAIET
jgi:hypothetical protein